MDAKTADVAEEYGPLLHTALRKCCDSTPTTYAWNVIHLLSKSWTYFAQYVGEQKPTDGKSLHTAYQDWCNVDWDTRRCGDPFYAFQIFNIALEDFEEDDWAGFAGYLDG